MTFNKLYFPPSFLNNSKAVLFRKYVTKPPTLGYLL